MGHKLIVISVDALVFEDVEYLKTKPNFKFITENGSMVERVRSIYPSLTYPCHTTMATGCYPDKHGIYNNFLFELSDNPAWLFGHENVKCEDILDACKKAGLKTASVAWPVSGNHRGVDYLVNECWPMEGEGEKAFADTLIQNGTPQWLLDEVVKKHLPLRIQRKHPQTAYFSTSVAAEIIRKYKPDILLLHVANIDHYRHNSGVFSELVTRGLDEADDMLGMIINAAKDAGIFEKTNFIITSDHGQINKTRHINLNSLFVREGLIKTDLKGEITDWFAWCHSSGMSGQIYLKNPDDEKTYNHVYSLLKEKSAEGLWGISTVYSKEELNKMHLGGAFSLMVETDGYSAFKNDWKNAPALSLPLKSCGCVGAEHGFHPAKGPKPTFIACGPDILKGVILPEAELADGAPTYAKIMGVKLASTEGRTLVELLKPSVKVNWIFKEKRNRNETLC